MKMSNSFFYLFHIVFLNHLVLSLTPSTEYRDQLVDVLNKNEDLGNYCRKLALEYNTLMNSLK